jgi:putative restriction endonuclease
MSGYFVCRYRLVRLGDDGSPVSLPHGTVPGPAPREQVTVQRLVRSTAVARKVKELHDYTCQICGERIAIASGAYAEGAHIRPLGRPHDGPDALENILCLCPNDHVRFEFGALLIHEDMTFARADGTHLGHLRVAPSHPVSPDHLAYHRERFDLSS